MSSRYSYQPDLSAAGSQKSPGLYGRQQYDSGFSDTFQSIPAPPSLIYPGDVENGDSGINMDDMEPERDCVGTHSTRSTVQSPPAVPMEIEDATKLIARGSCSRPPVSAHTVTRSKRPVGPPRVPKKTMSTSSSTHSITTSHVRNVTVPPQRFIRATSPPRSTTTHTYSAPPFTTDKENQGPPSMPVLRSSSPLTCNNNFRSLQNVDRVPPMSANASIDLFQLREYMTYFLPDTKEGDTGFHLAVIHNQPDLLDKLLFIMSKDKNLKPVLDEQNTLYQTALHLATHLQQLDTMRKLLIAGATINITDHKGNTPLHIAAKFSSTRPLEEIVKYISIQMVLEVSQIRNNEGLSCVHVAAKNGNVEILRKLRNIGIDMDMQDFNSGKTALHLAAESNSLANVQFMLETCDADVNCLTYSGCSPLHIASGRGDISVVAYLVSMGADPELCTDEDDMALDLAGSADVHTFLTKVAALKWLL